MRTLQNSQRLILYLTNSLLLLCIKGYSEPVMGMLIIMGWIGNISASKNSQIIKLLLLLSVPR